MMDKHPRLRDSTRLVTKEPYPLNGFSDQMILDIGSFIVYLLYTGKRDITGADWGDAFARAIHGKHLDSPLGIADVSLGSIGWSMKTVKVPNPFSVNIIRLISGRCSPDYSYGITDPHKDIQSTGNAVLGIWNERVNIAKDTFRQVRTTVLIRSNDMKSFCLFEEDTSRFRSSEYTWTANRNGNLEGKDEMGNVIFTWQPHGSQFTIHTKVPRDARKFSVKKPPVLDMQTALSTIHFDPSWITIEN